MEAGERRGGGTNATRDKWGRLTAAEVGQSRNFSGRSSDRAASSFRQAQLARGKYNTYFPKI